jgi:hypothetical protein
VFDWVLVITRDPELRRFVAEAVANELDLRPELVVDAGSIAEGESALAARGAGSCGLVVASVTAPLSRRHSPPLDATDLTALEFARRVRGAPGKTPPFLFLVAFNDLERLKELAKIADACTVVCGVDLYKRLPDAIAELMRPGSARTGLPCINVDITLTEKASQWQLRARGALDAVDDGGVLNIRRAELDNLIRRSEVEMPDPAQLRRIGTTLFKTLMQNELDQQDLYGSFQQALGRLSARNQRFRDLELARIRFVVDKHTHPILLETIGRRLKDSEPDFWMLKAPIFRKYEQRADQYPLFKDRMSRSEPLDCLLIEGCTVPFQAPDPVPRRLESIPLARDEVDCLQAFLDGIRQKDPLLKIGEVKVLSYPRDAADPEASDRFAAEIRRVLETGASARRPWRLVHYAGHSAKGLDDRGYLVVGPGRQGLVDAEAFAVWARKAQFVFMSSCRSAGAYFVTRLVERTIPAVLGYRWLVDDRVARAFSERFYRHLFEDEVGRRFLEYAFLKARKDLYRADTRSSAWASPILVMQMLDPQLDD